MDTVAIEAFRVVFVYSSVIGAAAGIPAALILGIFVRSVIPPRPYIYRFVLYVSIYVTAGYLLYRNVDGINSNRESLLVLVSLAIHCSILILVAWALSNVIAFIRSVTPISKKWKSLIVGAISAWVIWIFSVYVAIGMGLVDIRGDELLVWTIFPPIIAIAIYTWLRIFVIKK